MDSLIPIDSMLILLTMASAVAIVSDSYWAIADLEHSIEHMEFSTWNVVGVLVRLFNVPKGDVLFSHSQVGFRAAYI